MATYTTLPEATTAALANADYAEVASVTKAKAYVTALESMLILMPKATAKDAASVSLAPEEIRMRLKAANAWLLANDTDSHGGGVKHLSVGNFRG